MSSGPDCGGGLLLVCCGLRKRSPDDFDLSVWDGETREPVGPFVGEIKGEERWDEWSDAVTRLLDGACEWRGFE